jgi:vancomycin resistance protein YoaR
MRILFILGMLLFNQQSPSDNAILITLDGKTIAIENRNDFIHPISGGLFINIDHFLPFIKKLEKQVYQRPENASIDDNGKIHPETIGYRLDRESLTTQMYNNLFETGSSIIEIKKTPIYPEVDSEILSTIREKRIGQYLTYFNSNNKKRSYNILLAAKAINNQVVFPGQTFSFNKVVGKRTAHKGYLPAPIIVKGELSEGIGGGICQVSSTLFNAVDNSGLKIVERYSHSKNVPYVPHGRDATVSWYGPDFKFTNKYNQPILIKAKTYEGKLLITIYSSDLINFKQRKIPSASNLLPEEIKVTSEIENKSSD